METRKENPVRTVILAGILGLFILMIMAALLVPRFTGCSGSSSEGRAKYEKLFGLVKDFKMKTGRVPKNYEEIDRVLHPDPEYAYNQYCDQWPHTRSRRGTLKGAIMKIAPHQLEEGWTKYLIRLQDDSFEDEIEIFTDVSAAK